MFINKCIGRQKNSPTGFKPNEHRNRIFSFSDCKIYFVNDMTCLFNDLTINLVIIIIRN